MSDNGKSVVSEAMHLHSRRARAALRDTSPNQGSLAVRRYARRQTEDRAMHDACMSATESVAVSLPTHRLQLWSLARGLAHLNRHTAMGEWPEKIAAKVAVRMKRGLKREVLLGAVRAGLEHVSAGLSATLMPKVEQELEFKLSQPAPEPDPKAAPKPAARPAMPRQRRKLTADLAAKLDDTTEAEQCRMGHAVEALRQSMMLMKPWMRAVVAGRIGQRKSNAALAAEVGVPADDVERILAEARPKVQVYTSYFEDDWWWQDVPENER